MENEYIKSEIVFKDLKFNISLNVIEDKNEVFKVVITNLNNNRQIMIDNFKNSIMEYNLTQEIKEYEILKFSKRQKYPFSYFLKNCISLKGWGGYDQVKSLKELDQARTFNLIYSILNDFSRYVDFLEGNLSFKEFCDNFGYDEDSIKAKEIYKSCLSYYEKIVSLYLTKEQKQYFLNEAQQETDQFNKDLKAVFNI
jgi:hypothetical protein